MERVIVVEVLGRRGETVERLRLTRFPATIGRAWSSDVVITDPTVDAQHARIVEAEDGSLAIEDLGSVNGMCAGAGRERVPRVALNGATTVRLGRAALRLVDAAHPVPAAVVDVVPTGRLAGLLASPRAMLGLVGACLALAVFAIWLGNYKAHSAADVTETSVGIVLVALLWAGIWSVIGRFTVHQFRFLQHLAVLVLALLILWSIELIGGWVDFFFPTRSLTSGIVDLSGTVVMVAMLVTHLGLVTQARRLRRIIIAGLITGSLWGLTLIGERAEDDFGAETVTIGDQLKPVPASMIPAGNVDRFLAGTDRLKTRLDRKAEPGT